MVAKAAQEADVQWCLVAREQTHANKFKEAQALTERFPELSKTLSLEVVH